MLDCKIVFKHVFYRLNPQTKPIKTKMGRRSEVKVTSGEGWILGLLVLSLLTIVMAWVTMMPKEVSATSINQVVYLETIKKAKSCLILAEIEPIEPMLTEDIFARTERQTGVHQETLREIWQRETRSGTFFGESENLDKLKKKPRQWEAFLKICKTTSRKAEDQVCSIGGAIGHMQFLPLTWLENGIDADDDGVVDPWSLNDAVATAGRYLQRLKYYQLPWRAVRRYCGGSNEYTNVVLRRAYKNGATELNL